MIYSKSKTEKSKSSEQHKQIAETEQIIARN